MTENEDKHILQWEIVVKFKLVENVKDWLSIYVISNLVWTVVESFVEQLDRSAFSHFQSILPL